MRPNTYGKLDSIGHKEHYKIWLTRNQELDETPRFGLGNLLILEDDDDKVSVLFNEILRIAKTHLCRRSYTMMYMHICAGMTLDEVAKCFDITRERVRQIVLKSIREIRSLVGVADNEPPERSVDITPEENKVSFNDFSRQQCYKELSRLYYESVDFLKQRSSS